MLGVAKMVCQTPLIFNHDIGLALLSNNNNISNGSYIMWRGKNHRDIKCINGWPMSSEGFWRCSQGQSTTYYGGATLACHTFQTPWPSNHYYKSWFFLLGKLVKKDLEVTLVNLTKMLFWTSRFQQCLFWPMAFFTNYTLSFWLAKWLTIWLINNGLFDWVNFILKLKSFKKLLLKKLIGR